MAPTQSTMRPGSADGPLPGKAFQGLQISVPYARWRGYGTEHGFHSGKISTFCSGDEDCPEGSFTIVFAAAEKCDPINLSWEQILGIKKHGSVKKACSLGGEPSGVSIAQAKQQLAAWRQRAAEEAEESEEEDAEEAEEDEDAGGDGEEDEDEPTGGGGGAGGVEQLGEASGDEGDEDDSDGVRGSKKRSKKQRRQRKAQASDLSWEEIDRAVPPTRPVETPAFIWRGLKQRATRATSDDALSFFDRCWPEAVKALRYEETMRYADEQDFDWDATGGPPSRPEARRTVASSSAAHATATSLPLL